MRKKKFFAVVMAAVMTLSMVACGETQTSNDTTPIPTTAPVTATPTPTTEPTKAPDPTATPVPAPVGVENASITFEDGKMDFVKAYMEHATSGEVELSLTDFNGSKALKVVNVNSKVPWIGIDVSSLLGANVANVAGVEMMVGTSNDDGNFYAVSGEIYSWFGTDLTETKLGDWSVYMEKKNPKVATVKVPEGCNFVADANNIMLLNFNTDNGLDATGTPGVLYIDDIRFFDAAGNTITADTSVAFVDPEGFVKTGRDANLLYLDNATALEGFAVSAGGWTQAGIDLTDEQRALIKPGCVIEIAYNCSEPVWMVAIGENPLGGWLRGVEQTGYVSNGYVATDKTVVQYTYEQLAEFWGEGFEQYLTTLQCEGKDAWEVYSVTVGEKSEYANLGSVTNLEGFAVSAGGWTQAGIDLTDEQRALIKPGCVIEIAYKCSEPIWMVAIGENPLGGWLRGVEQTGYVSNGSVSEDGTTIQYTYEQLAEFWGEGFEQYLTTLQCEGKDAWEVYSVKVGQPIYPATNVTNLDGFAVSAGGWTQAGIDLTDEQRALFGPGCVINIEYNSASPVWMVAIGENPLGGWLRGVEQTNYVVNGAVSPDGTSVQYTYEQLVPFWGENFGQYLTTLQCEGKDAWEVYSVTVGQTPAGKEGPSAVEDPAVEEPKTEEPVVEEPKEEEPKTEEPKTEEPKEEEPKTEEPKEEAPKTEASVSGKFNGPIANYSEVYKIPAEELAQFADGATLTFNFEIIENAAEPWYQIAFVKCNETNWPMYKDAEDWIAGPVFLDNYFIDLGSVSSPYSVTLSAEAVAKAANSGFGIQVHCINVLDYTLTAPTDAPKTEAPAENTSAAEGTSYTVVTKPNEYWGVQTDVIPAEAFANCKNGAKIVVEFTQDESNWWNLILNNNEDSGWVKMGDYITNYTCNKDGFIDKFSKGDTSMTLELNAAGVEKILATGKGVLFQGYALNVTKATIIPQ